MKENEIGHAKRQLLGAQEARKSHDKIPFPSVNDYKKVVKCNLIKNCPITVKDINICEKVCDKSIAALKGKTVHTTPLEVKTNAILVPKRLPRLHQEITLEGHAHFINHQTFVTTTLQKTHLETVDPLIDQKSDTIVSSLTDVINLHKDRGVKVTMCICSIQRH